MLRSLSHSLFMLLSVAVGLAAQVAQAQPFRSSSAEGSTPAASALQPAGSPGDGPSLRDRTLGVAPLQFAAGVGAAVVSVPTAMYLGAWVGTLSNHLVLAALPSLLLLAALPPLAVALTEWWVGNKAQPGSMRWRPALWVALGVQLVAIVGGVLLGVSTQDPGAVALFTAAEAVALPLAVTTTLGLTRFPSMPPGSGGGLLAASVVLPVLTLRFP